MGGIILCIYMGIDLKTTILNECLMLGCSILFIVTNLLFFHRFQINHER